MKAYVWKEWREFRSTILGLALIGTVLVFVAAALCAPKTFAQPVALVSCGGFAALAVLLTIGSEIVAADADGQRVRFLERLPLGLETALIAKLVVFFAAFVGLIALTFATALAAGRWRSGTAVSEILPECGYWVARFGPAAAALALWTLAVSAWAPRGTLALPIAAIVLAVLGAPVWLLGCGVWYGPSPTETGFFVASTIASGLVAAWMGFPRGRGLGRGKGYAARQSLLVGGLCLVPAWAWGGVQLATLRHVDPSSSGFYLHRVGGVTADGRYAILSASNYDQGGWKIDPSWVLRVDLETGGWEAVGGFDAELRVVEQWDSALVPTWPNVSRAFHVLDAETKELRSVIDGEIGAIVDAAMDQDPDSIRWYSPAGLGVKHVEGGDDYYWDPFRGTHSWEHDLLPEDWSDVLVEILVSPGLWVVNNLEAGWSRYGIEGEGSNKAAWWTLDPETQELRQLPWPVDDLSSHSMLPNGDVLLCVENSLCLGDPETGALRPVAVPESAVRQFTARNAYEPSDSYRDGWPILISTDDEILRLDLDEPSAECVAIDPWEEYVLCALDRDTVLVIEQGTSLVQVTLSTGERELVFPRSARE